MTVSHDFMCFRPIFSVLWDDQYCQYDAEGRVLLVCDEEHEWYSADEDLSEESSRQRALSHEADEIADIIERELTELEALPDTPKWHGYTASERERIESKTQACRTILARLGRLEQS